MGEAISTKLENILKRSILYCFQFLYKVLNNTFLTYVAMGKQFLEF